jgi:hypothetical protein
VTLFQMVRALYCWGVFLFLPLLIPHEGKKPHPPTNILFFFKKESKWGKK